MHHLIDLSVQDSPRDVVNNLRNLVEVLTAGYELDGDQLLRDDLRDGYRRLGSAIARSLDDLSADLGKRGATVSKGHATGEEGHADYLASRRAHRTAQTAQMKQSLARTKAEQEANDVGNHSLTYYPDEQPSARGAGHAVAVGIASDPLPSDLAFSLVMLGYFLGRQAKYPNASDALLDLRDIQDPRPETAGWKTSFDSLYADALLEASYVVDRMDHYRCFGAGEDAPMLIGDHKGNGEWLHMLRKAIAEALAIPDKEKRQRRPRRRVA